MIQYILYISAAAGWIEDAALKEILTVSRKNNQLDGITGVLLYNDRNFVQLLEGNQQAVKQTFDRIKTDPRHSDITVISSGALTERCFPAWEMGFKAIGSESKQALNDFIDQARKTFAGNNCEYPVKMLQAFLRKMN